MTGARAVIKIGGVAIAYGAVDYTYSTMTEIPKYTKAQLAEFKRQKKENKRLFKDGEKFKEALENL